MRLTRLCSSAFLGLLIAALPGWAEEDHHQHHHDGEAQHQHDGAQHHDGAMDDHANFEEAEPQLPPPGPRERLLRLLRLADADDTGEVTLEEIQAIAPDFTQEQFLSLDRNGDGVLSRRDLHHFSHEGVRRFLRILQEADDDHDGTVTFDELQTLLPRITEEQFNHLDLDGDGILSIEDLPLPPPRLLDRLSHLLAAADTNDDGEVTFEELQAVAPDLTQAQFHRLDRNGDDVISSDDFPEPPRDPRLRLLEMIREADVDGDGEVTFEELQALFPDLTEERFARLDRNEDGVLTADDIPDSPIPAESGPRLHVLHALIHGDLNGDGVLDFTEIAVAFPDAPAELLAHLDGDGDWIITRHDIMAVIAPTDNGETLAEPSDVDADGTTSASDIQVTVNHAMGNFNGILPADIDENGAVDAADIQLVLLAILD